jgi:photosystem II stability/assembly factor-like uncharacterized protein
MNHKGFVVFVNLMISLTIIFALVGTLGEVGLVIHPSALAAPLRAQLEVTAVDPESAPNDVDTTITISGNNFDETAAVYLGNTELAEVNWEDENTLQAVVPWGMSTGVYDLIVENTPEEIATLDNAFEVLPGLDVWTAGAIEGGDINEIVINPQDPNTLYASSGGEGLFRSRDAGENWEFVFSNGLAMNVAIDPVDPNYLYLFGPWQLFRSDDAGDTWETLYTEFPVNLGEPEGVHEFGCGGDIKPYPHPTESGTVFASVCYAESGYGLIKSTDHRETWDPSTKDINDPYITAVAFHPGDSKKIVAGTAYGELYVSKDGGDSWESLGQPMNYIGLTMFNPHNPDELWFAGQFMGKYTDDKFTEWEEIPSPTDEPWDSDRMTNFQGLHFSPNDIDHIYTTNRGVGYKSTDGGENWGEYGMDGLIFPHDIAESPESSGVVAVYMGDRYFGIYKSTNDGVDWEQKNQGLTAATPEYLSVSPADPSVVYGSMQHTPGIYRGTDYGSTWQFLSALDRDFQSIAADPFTPGRVLNSDRTKICRSDDGGETWPECVELPVPEEYINCPNYVEALRAHPEREGVYLAGLRHWCEDEWFTGSGSIYYTTDGGDHWYLADTPSDIKVVHDLAFDSVNPDIAYADTASGFYRSEDAGKVWTLVESRPSNKHDNGSIAVEPKRESGTEHWIVILDDGHLRASSDQGKEWDRVINYPDECQNINQIAFTPTDPPELYAASRTGLWRSSNYGETWSRAAGDLGYVNIVSLAVVKEEDRVILYAATPGGYAARTEVGMMSTSVYGLRDSTTLVNPGVYRYTQTPGVKIFLPLVLQ